MSEELTGSASEGLVSLPAIQNIAKRYDLSAKAFAFTFRKIAMPDPHTEAEFVSCCLVALEHGLNPLTKEIYFMRDKHGRIQAIVSVDGWVKKCNEHPQFDGMEFTDERDDKGNIVSMTVAIYRKDRTRPIRITEYMKECIQVRDKNGPWQSHPNRMLRNRTLCQGARIAFGFAGIMEPDEFHQWQGQTIDITPASEPAKTSLLDPFADIATETKTPEPEPASEPEEPVPDDDAPIVDVEGYLAKLEGDISCCESSEELKEIETFNAAVIARLPKDAQKRAKTMLKGAAA